MKYVTFSLPTDPTPRAGVLSGTHVLDIREISAASGGSGPATVLEVIQAGPNFWRSVAAAARSSTNPGRGYRIDEVRLHAPIPRPLKNVFCLGLNYASHMEETSRARGREAKLPEVPVFFTKPPTGVAAPDHPIRWDPLVTKEVDYEVELAVIVGVGGKNIAREDALGHVFGYTVANDVSARDLQMKHLQWFKGKSLDGFCPMGPSIVTADEFGDPQAKRISLRVNGDVKQNSTTANMIFSVAAVIDFLSRGMTLEPGDIISTGTPEGVGLGRVPPEYLKDGDLVEAEIEGIGILRNRVELVGDDA
jgi:2-keto-4-pentenoate hydratase/2-oxohepta-3-ene-1,7-dioic acid hydratase in catechol pathway